MSFSLGIVGLPNVGKSTLFQALTKNKVDASNYPFCTIDPNVGVVAVPDERLNKLTKLSNSAKTIPTTIEFVDIAGLVKGAAKGEGLGNKFLHNIREVDAIVEVVRLFEDADVTHVHGDIDPENDKEVIKLELILADLEMAEKRLDKVTDQLKGPAAKELVAEQAVLRKIVTHLKADEMLNTLNLSDDELGLIKSYNFLTIKPLLYIHNIHEKDITKSSKLPDNTVQICAKLESELADLADSELPNYLEQLGLKNTGLDQLIQKSYQLLKLITYITTGPEETRAWTITKGTKAPQAAGRIHGDFEKGFIRIEVINWQDLLNEGSWTQARESGKIKTQGKDYVIHDGDVVYFHSN